MKKKREEEETRETVKGGSRIYDSDNIKSLASTTSVASKDSIFSFRSFATHINVQGVEFGASEW